MFQNDKYGLGKSFNWNSKKYIAKSGRECYDNNVIDIEQTLRANGRNALPD